MMVGENRAFPGLMGLVAQRLRSLAVLAVVAALLVAAGLVAVVAERADGPRVSSLVFPAKLAQHRQVPLFGGHSAAFGWNQPAGVAVLQGRRFLLDTGNDRILELGNAGMILSIYDHRRDERLTLQEPMAIASDGSYLYVANSGMSQVLVLEPSGEVVKVLALAKTDPTDEELPRPIGLAITRDGELLVSDAANHRVLRYGADGQLLQAIGTGKREGGPEGFNTPAGLAVDATGNIYVVDVLNGRVVKLTPEGAFLRQFGRLGDTAGTFSRPKDVAVDSAGDVYVSDGLLASVQVFSPEGAYLGLIGREDPGDRHSASLFQAPAGLTISDGALHVVDRFAGLFEFQLPHQD